MAGKDPRSPKPDVALRPFNMFPGLEEPYWTTVQVCNS